MMRPARFSILPGLCLLVLSCSEGPGNVPRGGTTFRTSGSSSSSAPANTSCPTPGYTVALGDPAPDLFNDDPGRTLADGSGGGKVACRVRGTTEITFSGSIRGSSTVDGKQGELRLTDGTLGADGLGTVNVSLSTPISASTASNIHLQNGDTPCTVEGITNDSGAQFGDGLLWARFRCNAMTASGQPSTFCTTSGVVVFEDCDR